MLDIPYVQQPDPMSCALACYTMVAKHFFPDTTFEQLAEISNWEKGYVIWSFKFWLWIMDKGIKIEEHDTLDYKAWAKEGLEGLHKSISEKEFQFYLENTKDIESYSNDIEKVLKHPNFRLIYQKPTFEILEKEVKNNNVCEVVLDSRSLRDREGFSLHRVVVLDISNETVTFRDPAYEAYSRSSKEKFKSAWLEVVNEPELCIYSKI